MARDTLLINWVYHSEFSFEQLKDIDMSLKYRLDIDGLRAVAVLSVVVFHFFPTAIPGGFIGVDVFFVISGFLITSIIINDVKRDRFTILGFYKKRIIRIFPALLTVLLSIYFFGWFAFLQGDFSSLGKHIFGGSFFISNLLLWSESGYFDSSSQLKPLLHLWSLGVEEQFYLFWPILLMFFARTKKGIYLTSIIILIISFFIGIYTMHSTSGSNYYSPFSRFWELMFGALLAAIKNNKDIRIGKTIANALSFIGAILLISSLALINESMAFPGYIALLPVVGATFLIMSEGGAVNKVLSLKPIVFIGLISYPLYLWHWPLYSIARIITVVEPSQEIRLSLLLSSFALAYLTYRTIESPIRYGSKNNTIIYSLLGSVFAMGFVGLLTNNLNGIPSRQINGSIGEYASITEPYKFFDFTDQIRNEICHSVSVDTAMKNGCISNKSNQIFIWGDSYAATLYSGILSVIKTNGLKADISQATDGNGPPFFVKGKFTDSGKDLFDANEQRLQFVKNEKPNVVLISWMATGGNASLDPNVTASGLTETINKIREASPNSRVVVIGPFPEWQDSLIRQVIKYYKDNHEMPPEHMQQGVRPEAALFDKVLKPSIEKAGADYVSTVDTFCNKDGCLIRTGPGASSLTAIDWGHMTSSGAKYLIENNKDTIFKGLK